MKWALVMMVLETSPVQTGLVYDTIGDCYKAEEFARAEYAKHYNAWSEWAMKNPEKSGYPESMAFMKKRALFGVCVPSSGR